jgi:signal transduction histidine kinase
MPGIIKLKINIFELSDANDKIQIKKINENFDTVLNRMREISYNLTPNILKRTGLISALNEYIYKINNSRILKISFNSSNEPHLLDENAAVNIYRIVQEIIHNTIKHAAASQLDIKFKSEKNKLIISLKDDGIGFDQKEVLNRGGLGLKSLYNRSQLMNGKMFLDSNEGTGTEFTFEIPC